MYCGNDALSTKPVSVMLIWALLIPATRGHAIQSKVFAMITDCSACSRDYCSPDKHHIGNV